MATADRETGATIPLTSSSRRLRPCGIVRTTALLAIDAAPHSPRAERIAPLAGLLLSSFEQLRDAADNSDWKEVNLTARLLGWPRLGAAQSWLEQNQTPSNPALDAFRDAAQTAASGQSAAA